jgi:uncharacterized protein YciW
MKEDFRKIDFEEKSLCVLNYAEKLTLELHKITENDVSKLRETGWKDEDILLINMIVSYFNFVNRIALGLGVEFSKEEIAGYKY